MTTYQEPQPVSRRAARQHERAESHEGVPTESISAGGQFAQPSLVDPGQPGYSAGSDALWDTLARRAAQLPRTTPEPYAPAGEAGAIPSQGGRRAAGEQSGNRPAPEPLNYTTVGGFPLQFAPPQNPAASVYPDSQATEFRTRDFSPESRRSLREAAQVQNPFPAPTAYQAHDTFQPAPSFGYPASVPEAPRAVAAPPMPIVDPLPIEQTLTRRELRALLNAEQALTQDALWPAPFAQVPPREPAPQEPAPWTAPVGHWSNQLDAVDDRFAEIESTINRTVGGTSASTSALVLPEIPMGSDIRGALTHTGEVMLTGSINLPASLSSTGTTARIDQGGIDDLFDWREEELVSVDSRPVRAVTAVSTRIGGHGVTHTHKPKGTRGLTALLVTACALAVAVTGLIVAAFAFNIL